MRFLIGLICGAGLIFAAVGALGTGNGALTDRLPGWLDDVAVRVGDWLSLPPRPPAAEGERVERLPASDLAGRQAGDAIAAAVASEEMAAPEGLPAASEPIPRPPDPLGVDDAADEAVGSRPAQDQAVAPSGSREEDVQALVAEIFGPRGDAADPQHPVSATPPVPMGAGAPADGEAAGPSHGVGRSGSQTVWVPFHSQMSAVGFASRLSESLGHPFDVERRGPGRYQVVFAYGDEAERSALLEEAAAVTGLPL